MAKDVCEILELGNVTKALYALDEDERIILTNSEGNPKGIANIYIPDMISIMLIAEVPKRYYANSPVACWQA